MYFALRITQVYLSDLSVIRVLYKYYKIATGIAILFYRSWDCWLHDFPSRLPYMIITKKVQLENG